jgi:hypothetical protein
MEWDFPSGYFDLEARGRYHTDCRLVGVKDGVVTFDFSDRCGVRVRIQMSVDTIEAIYALPPMPTAERLSLG